MNSTDMHDEADNADVSWLLFNRRRLLTLGGAAAATAGLAALGARSAFAGDVARDGVPVSASEAAAACALSTESIEGPYYLHYELVRRNVVEDRKGVPLNLRLRVIDSSTCRPIRVAGVEIWHCDALGVYSGYTAIGSGGGPATTPSIDPSSLPTGSIHAEPTDDLTYLRGLQFSDRNGFVVFDTIVPGWYSGRAIHIHTKVHTEGRATPAGYQGGHTAHTAQFYFDEKFTARLAAVNPYAVNAVPRVTLDTDILYDRSGSTGGLLSLRYDARHITRGVQASLTISVDPSATNDGSGIFFPGGIGVPSPSGPA